MEYKSIGRKRNGIVVGPEEFVEVGSTVSSKKKTKAESLNTLVITSGTVAYDANGTAIGNMAGVLSVANFKYNQYTSVGMELPDGTKSVLTRVDAYTAIYTNTIIYWRGADNVTHQITVAEVCDALEQSMLAIATTLGL